MAASCNLSTAVFLFVTASLCDCSTGTNEELGQAGPTGELFPTGEQAPRTERIACVDAFSGVRTACRELCQKVIHNCFGSEWLSLGVLNVYGLQVQPLRSGIDECANACAVGREQQTNAASLAPTRCGPQLVALLNCVADTGSCGADAPWISSCPEENTALSQCASECGATLKCDPAQCSGVVLSGDVQGDIGCTAHCRGTSHCARTFPDACSP
jgi:hypothetical protein